MQQPQSHYRLPDSNRHIHWGLFWRLLAVAALVIYAILLIAFFRFLLRNIIVAILFCLTTGVAAYAGWLIFSGKARRRRIGIALLTVSAVALVVELTYMILAISSAWALAAFLLLAGAYVLLTDRLRSRYRREATAATKSSTPTAHFKKPYLIINPKSGNGRAIKAHIEELARQQGIKVILLRKGDDIENAARQAAKDGADVLGISGGDGSIGAVVKIALERNLPVVVLPGGTRCHFARDIGLEPEHIVDSLEGFRGVQRRIDVGSINGRIFLNNVSFGLYADVIDNPEYREHKRDTTRKVLQELSSGEKRHYDLLFRHDSKQFKQAAQVLVGVNSYQTLNVFELGRREKLDAGVLQVTVIEKLDDTAVRRLLETASIAALSHRTKVSGMEQWEVRSFRISNLTDSMVAGVDGEREEYATPVNVRILPKALRVFVPAEGQRNRPKPALSWETASQIRHMVSPR